MKKCTRCEEIKPKDEFQRKRVARDGLQPKCRDCSKLAAREYRERNPDKVRESRRLWRERNASKISEDNRLHYERNSAKARAMARLHYERNREARLAANMRRRAKAGSIIGQDQEYVAILRRDPCSYCGTTGALTIDHIEPLHRGGANSQENLTAACRSCNCSKGTRDLLSFLLRKSA